jgi:alpha-L-rhamnosidase
MTAKLSQKKAVTHIICFFLLMIQHILVSTAAVPGKPFMLRTANHTEGMGVDGTNLQFAWYLDDTDRGEFQTAYRILIASTPDNLEANMGDVWDSGKVHSSHQYGIKYRGAELRSNSKYFWKVMSWDKDNNTSPWSEVHTFVTGYMEPSDWNAKWIKSVRDTLSTPYMMRKGFSVVKKVDYAIANVCGVGQFEFHLNGEKVGDHVLDPGWTDYSKSQQYVTFEVTDLLKVGFNAVAVWLADGFMDIRKAKNRFQGRADHSNGPKRLIFELIIHYTDGSIEKILSDETWKFSFGPITYSNAFGGEDYDARKEIIGWEKMEYDDSGWSNVMETQSPGGTLKPQSQPPIKVVEVLEPVNKEQTGDSIVIYFGKTYAGIFEISLRGKAGQTVLITLDDGTQPFLTHCEYTLKGGATETFRPRFFYFGQNKIIIKGASLSNNQDLPQLVDTKGLVLSSAAKHIGHFSSSDTLYNRIFEINKQGITSNLYSYITDCPHREKAAWMNDINFTIPSFTALYDLHTLFVKITEDIAESQQDEGWVLSMSPFYLDPLNPADPFHCSPFYDITSMRFPWTIYQHYGDRDILQKQYEVAKSAIAYLTERSNGNLLDYGLGDWLSPDPVSREFIETCIYYDFATHIQKWAELIGKENDAKYFLSLSMQIKNAFNDKFFNRNTRNYGMQQTANTVPLYHGMCPPGEESYVFNALVSSIVKNNYSVQCGQNAHGYMLQVLSRYGRDDLVARIHTNRTGPGYAYWIAMGKSNTPERWDGTLSQQHHMNNSFPEWLCKNLAGISNRLPGFDMIEIRPTTSTNFIPKQISYTLETVKGVIVSGWNKKGNSFELNVTIPVNSTADIFIPTFGMEGVLVSEGDHILWKNDKPSRHTHGIDVRGKEKDPFSNKEYIILHVGSGHYTFTSNWP